MLKIHTPDEHWELFPDVDRILDGDVVTQAMKDAAQDQVRFSVISPIQFLHEFLQPGIRPLNRGVPDLQAGEFHAKRRARFIPTQARVLYRDNKNGYFDPDPLTANRIPFK